MIYNYRRIVISTLADSAIWMPTTAIPQEINYDFCSQNQFANSIEKLVFVFVSEQ